MRTAREYEQYGISKKRFSEILEKMLNADDELIFFYAVNSDPYISSYLVESIRYNVSFERLEAMHGTLPISKTDFYRKRRLMFHYMDIDMKREE